MSTRILFVRAVNVGGVALPVAEFREILAALGAEAVRSHIASGNAIVELTTDAAEFDRAVEAALTARYGWRREVMSRDVAELRSALARHPFDVVDPKRSFVSFLGSAPDDAAIEFAADVPRGDDEWAVDGAELHLRYAHGAGRAQLDANRLMKRLGVIGTARNLRTVRAVLEIAGG